MPCPQPSLCYNKEGTLSQFIFVCEFQNKLFLRAIIFVTTFHRRNGHNRTMASVIAGAKRGERRARKQHQQLARSSAHGKRRITLTPRARRFTVDIRAFMILAIVCTVAAKRSLKTSKSFLADNERRTDREFQRHTENASLRTGVQHRLSTTLGETVAGTYRIGSIVPVEETHPFLGWRSGDSCSWPQTLKCRI